MPDSNEPRRDRITQFLTGELDPTTAQPGESHLRASESQRVYLAGVQASIYGDDVGAMPLVEDSRRKFMAQLAEGNGGASSAYTHARTKEAKTIRWNERHGPRALGARFSSQYLGRSLAAGALVLAAVVFGTRVISSHPVPSNVRHYATQAGQRIEVDFTDAHIVLAPASRMTVHTDPATNSRVVSLIGEGFFEVAHNRTPFVVRTGNVVTRVLGTAFTVRRYAPTDPARIAVISGKVSSQGHGPAVTISAGEVARVTDSTASAQPVANMSGYTEWTHGRLVFDSVPVREMLSTIGQWYGYEFRLGDSTIAKKAISVVFNTNDAADMLVVLRSVLNVTMTSDGKVIVLTPQRTTLRRAPQPRHTFLPQSEVGR